MRGLFAAVLAVALLSGCSSDDDTDPAVDQCKLLTNTWCSHSLDCLVQVNRLSSSEQPDQLDACNRVAQAAVPCDKAVDIASSYDQCLRDIDAMDCATWDVETSQLSTIKLPNSCAGAIKVTQ